MASVLGDRVVEVAAQSVEELGEDLLAGQGLRSVEQRLDARGVALGDLGDVLGPVLPVAAVADLLDDLGVDGVAPFVELWKRGKRALNCGSRRQASPSRGPCRVRR